MKQKAAKAVVYIARDIDRALGAEPSESYLIVSNDGDYARTVKDKRPDSVLLIQSPAPLDTFELLSHPETADFLSHAKDFSLLVFKPTSRIEELCAQKKWDLLNPSATLAERIENKISQVEWLGELASLLPAFKVMPLKDATWEKKSLVVQFAHAHTGEGTVLINDAKSLADLQVKFPDRPAKVSEFIKGPVFTCNIIVVGAQIHIGNPSYQITGMPPFTESPFATVGNDWSLTHSVLDERLLGQFRDIAEKVGAKMRESGWKGLFGIDVIFDEERGELKLLEINARQPASTTFESQLQAKFRGHGLEGATIFEAHLAALLDSPSKESIIEINDGAQVIQRVTKANPIADAAKVDVLEKAGYSVIAYQNLKANADLLRIQSDKGIMERPGKFNARGEKIAEVLE